MDNKITKERIDRHLEYDWFKYVLAVIIAVVLWVSVYSTTDKPADYQKIDIMAVVPAVNETASARFKTDVLDAYGDVIAEVNWDVLSDDMYLSQIIMTRGQTSDFFIAPLELFESYATQGLFLSFENIEKAGYFEPDTFDSSVLYTAEVEGETSTYGIVLNGLADNMFFIYDEITNEENETTYKQTYVMGIIAANLTSSNGGGNKGTFNGKKQDSQNAQVFGILQTIVTNYANYIVTA